MDTAIQFLKDLNQLLCYSMPIIALIGGIYLLGKLHK